jgi:hypothetical protein
VATGPLGGCGHAAIAGLSVLGAALVLAVFTWLPIGPGETNPRPATPDTGVEAADATCQRMVRAGHRQGLNRSFRPGC